MSGINSKILFRNFHGVWSVHMLSALVIFILMEVLTSCNTVHDIDVLKPKISLVNSPNDIVTIGARFLATEIDSISDGKIRPRVFDSGVLSGGKGSAEVEMCQEGAIEIHVTTTAYLANLVPETSMVSLPFLFRDIDQVYSLIKNKSEALEKINGELKKKNLNVIAWWPRGFRQLTNNRRPVLTPENIKGLKFRVMNNLLFVDIMNCLGANPVPMDWGEVYNGLQLNTIDGQENAEDVIYSSRLYEVQKYMTVWDYSTDIEVVLVNNKWWNNLEDGQRKIIQAAADASVDFEAKLLKKNTEELRKKIRRMGMQINYLTPESRQRFRSAVEPVWEEYSKIFPTEYLDLFLRAVGQN